VILNDLLQLTPPFTFPSGVSTSVDGYYAKHQKMKFRAGVRNLAIYSQLDNDATTEDEDNLQLAMDEADSYVDTRARVLALTADTGTSNGHMIGTDNVYFQRISDLASDIALAFIYSARGFTGDQSNVVEGQMADMDQKARAELDQILDAVRVAQAVAAGSDGAAVVVAQCRPCEYRGPLHRWGW